MATLERNETGPSNACDWLTASSAPLGEKLTKTVCTVRLIITRGEPLSSEGLLAVGASEAFSMPRIITVGNTSLGDHLATLNALGGKLLLIALGAVYIMLLWDE